MNRSAIALGTLLLAAAPATAQYIGGGFGYRSGFGFSAHGPHFHFSAYSRSYYYSSPMFGYAWMPAYGAGYGSGFGNPFFLPPPPIITGPVFVVPIANNVPADAAPPVARGDFFVIAPKKKDEGFIAPKFDHIVVPEKPPMPRFDPFKKETPVGLSEPPLGVNQRLKLAREALAAGEFGAAAEHLDRILKTRPEDATALFLKSQAQFAAGQYSEAVATIRAGLKADAKWRTIEINPQDLFGRVARFDGLFGDLKRSRDANPDSIALEFLVAHQLWFTGDRVAAKASFTRLAARLKDADAVAPFLK